VHDLTKRRAARIENIVAAKSLNMRAGLYASCDPENRTPNGKLAKNDGAVASTTGPGR
jgi:hypothetical protein